jgi:CRP-like cAMP-binding protein
MVQTEEAAFPRLTPREIAVLKPLATAHDYADGEVVFRAGQADIDLCVVESGQIDILNPTDGKGRGFNNFPRMPSEPTIP